MFAFGITLLAGLSTGIGSLLTLYTKRIDKKFLSGTLGFSAGVMIYVSMIEMFPEALLSLKMAFGSTRGYGFTAFAFFGGIAFIAIIDKIVPCAENCNEANDMKEIDKEKINDMNLLRTGLFTALAIVIHNFPEGLASFIAALENPALGISIAISIAIHNIPEGMAVSAPIYYATASRRKAFYYSFLSGLSEPIGAIVGYFLFKQILKETMFGFIFAIVAGIMMYISLDELLPTAEKYGEHHIAIYGLVAGMAVMAINILIFS